MQFTETGLWRDFGTEVGTYLAPDFCAEMETEESHLILPLFVVLGIVGEVCGFR